MVALVFIYALLRVMGVDRSRYTSTTAHREGNFDIRPNVWLVSTNAVCEGIRSSRELYTGIPEAAYVRQIEEIDR